MAPSARPRIAWVTGAAGFIGRHVTARLRTDGWSVIGIDRSASPADVQVVGDLTSAALDTAFKTCGAPNLVFHGAGTGSVGDSARDPRGSHHDLVTATEILLAALLKNAPAARMVFPSSAAVYGDAGGAHLSEISPVNPISPYGQYKLAAEQACKAAAAEGLSIAIIRLFSVYGPGLRKQLPWDLGRKLLAGEPSVTLFGTGAETRDFLNVADAADLITMLGTTPFTTPLVVNGGTGIATRIDVFAGLLAEMLGAAVKIGFNGETRPGDPQHYRADNARLTCLGFRPQVDLRSGLARYAAWIKTQA
ncbi:MAG: NAD-dependent epimerase/dehydratase family protein [Rhodospirillaceae bacterium]